MCQISVQCPHCGTMNKDLYLHETEGRFECETCGRAYRVAGYEKPVVAVCTKCGCEDLKYEITGDGTWTAVCSCCGHRQKLMRFRKREEGRLQGSGFHRDRFSKAVPVQQETDFCRDRFSKAGPSQRRSAV